MDVTVRTRNIDFLSKLGNGLKQQFELQKFCDVTLTTTNQETPQSASSIECHKVVLSSSSRYFEHYITDNGDEVNIIDVSPVNIYVMKEVLAFLYNGECLIHESNVLGLLDTARSWVVPELATECCRYMVSSMTVDNVCYFYEVLSKFDRQETSAKLCYFIREHFKELYENKKIACLSVRSFNEIIAFNDIHVDNEDVIFKSAEMIVAKSAGAVDQDDLAKCWELIRFEFMSMPYLVDTVMFHDLLCDPPQRNYVKHAIAYNHKDSVVNNTRSRRKWGVPKPIKVKVTQDLPLEVQVDNRRLTYINVKKVVCRFNKLTNSWEDIMIAPAWIDETTSVASCPAGLIVAGKLCKTNGNRVSVLDLRNRREIRYPDLDSSRYGSAICSWDNSVFLIGGIYISPFNDYWKSSNSVLGIRENHKNWSPKGDFIGMRNAILAPIDSKSCYIVGSRSAYKFNIETAQCTSLPNFPEKYDHSSAGVVVYKNQLTVVKHDQLMTLENERWIIKRYKPLPSFMQAMIYGGEIHACIHDGILCKIIRYDSELNLWKATKIPTFIYSQYVQNMTLT